MNLPDKKLVWPEHFPPTGRWGKFFYGVRWLGPDISFFKGLAEQQAARTEAAMKAWPDERQRQIALQFGVCICAALGWKNPYFIPDDKAAAVAYGPKLLEYGDGDPFWDDAIGEFEKSLGKSLGGVFWKSVVDWQDKNVPFGDLISKLVCELDATTELKSS